MTALDSGPNVAPPEEIKPVLAINSNGWLGGQSVFDCKDERKIGRAMSASLGAHGVLLLVILFALSIRPAVNMLTEDDVKPKFVFLPDPGPGGGGGGSPAPAPPKPMEVPRHQAPPPVPVNPVPVPVVTPPPVPIPTLNAPIETNAANLLQMTGVSAVSLASYGGGGSGGGIGKGRGDGVGEGTGGGFGGGAYGPGNGVIDPVLIRQIEPNYTSEAMRAKIEGKVELEVVVLANGTVGEVRVKKSLDDKFGLDQEAMKAAKKWLFQPATRLGEKVPVIVILELTFRLH